MSANAPTSIEEKAAMWDALMSCARMRIIGHGKLGDPKLQHMGIEFWATLPEKVDDSHSRETFLTFVQTMRGT